MAEGPPLDRLRQVAAEHPLLSSLASSPLAPRLHLVGGCVRDALLGRPLKDLDLAAPSGDLEEVVGQAGRLGFHRVELDAERGIFRLVRRGVLDVDVAALRAGSLEEDLELRDLTVNALALSLEPGSPLVDPTGGLQDLERRLLRPPTPGVLLDDPLRVLRVLRFASQLGFEVDPGSWEAVSAAAPALAGTAGERRLEELRRLVGGPAWEGVVEVGRERGLWTPTIGYPVPRNAALVLRIVARLDELPMRQLRVLSSAALRLLILVARPAGEAPTLPLERREQRWLRSFRRADELADRLREGDEAALPWIWDLGEAAEGALAGLLLQDGGPELVKRARLVAKPQPLRDGRFLVEELGVPPGPAIRRALDRLSVAQVRGRVGTEAEAEEFLRDDIRVFDDAGS